MGRFRLGIPDSTATGFATTPLPPLTISRFPVGVGEQAFRSILDQLTLDSFTQPQEPVFSGALGERFVWSVQTVLSNDDALLFGALRGWQQAQIAAHDAWVEGGRVGPEPIWKLRWVDEIRPTDPEPAASRQLLTLQNTGYGWQYGYPVVDCLIALPESPLAFWAKERDQLSFTVIELP